MELDVIVPGTVLQGDGGVSTGATVLMSREYYGSLLLLCIAPASRDLYVTWRYNAETGQCYQGHYFSDLPSAVSDFDRR